MDRLSFNPNRCIDRTETKQNRIFTFPMEKVEARDANDNDDGDGDEKIRINF